MPRAEWSYGELALLDPGPHWSYGDWYPYPGVSVTGTGAATLPAFTAAASGSAGVKGTGAAASPLPAAQGAGTRGIRGAGAGLIVCPVPSGLGVRGIDGAAAAVCPAVRGSGIGCYGEGAPVIGSGAMALPLPAADGYGVTASARPGLRRMVVPAEKRALPAGAEDRVLMVLLEDRILRLAA